MTNESWKKPENYLISSRLNKRLRELVAILRLLLNLRCRNFLSTRACVKQRNKLRILKVREINLRRKLSPSLARLWVRRISPRTWSKESTSTSWKRAFSVNFQTKSLTTWLKKLKGHLRGSPLMMISLVKCPAKNYLVLPKLSAWSSLQQGPLCSRQHNRINKINSNGDHTSLNRDLNP